MLSVDAASLAAQPRAPSASSGQSSTYSGDLSISADGSVVAFTSNGTDLVAGVTDLSGTYNNNYHIYGSNVFAWTRSADAAQLVSGDPTGANTGDSESQTPVVSADGSTIVFQSAASNLVTGATTIGGTRTSSPTASPRARPRW